MSHPVQSVESRHAKAELPQFEVGDQVAVAVLIREPPPPGSKEKTEKERVQNFIGDVIAIKGRGLGRSFTVRRVVEGEGVERVFPFHSPLVTGVEVRRKGSVRRAKLYHLRRKSGKAARIRERSVQSGSGGRSSGAPASAGRVGAESLRDASGQDA
jgi:large subunit ribosomal protein L19